MLETLVEQAAVVGRISPTTQRLRAPGDLVARMRPRFDEVGITRLAEITGLDTVGWPVWAAVRPNASTLAVCQGKGPSVEAAQASAIMEAVEISVAERVRPTVIASPSTLEARGEAFDLLPGLIRRGHASPDHHQALGWVRGHDLITARDVWIPAQAVQIDPTDPDRLYWQSSDGLGSGNLMIEAVLHGLAERIERDAGEFWHLRSDQEVADACVDPAVMGSDEVSRQVAAIVRANLHLRLFDITSDVGVPTFFATLSPVPDGRESQWCHFDLASGMGCRLDPERAAAAAIGEALQTRLTTISGARDDFQPGLYRQAIASDILIYPRCRASRIPSPSVAAGVPLADALGVMMDRLRAAEVTSVVVVSLHEDTDFAVAKVVVPDLELPPGARAVVHGARLRRASERRA